MKATSRRERRKPSTRLGASGETPRMPKAPSPYATVSRARRNQRRGDADAGTRSGGTEPGRSADEEAAVGREPLAGEERAVVGGQEEGGLGDFLRLGPAAERSLRDECLPHERRDPL